MDFDKLVNQDYVPYTQQIFYLFIIASAKINSKYLLFISLPTMVNYFINIFDIQECVLDNNKIIIIKINKIFKMQTLKYININYRLKAQNEFFKQ